MNPEGRGEVKNRILLILLVVMLALSVGLTGCGGEQVPEVTEYDLIISSTEGGSVTTPGEGTFNYTEGTVVNLVAEPDEGYRFVSWSGDGDDVGDVEDTATAITMNGDYTIVACFAREIRDWHDLDAIRDNVGGSYILVNHLDSATPGYEELTSPAANGGRGWEPLPPFVGSFDGQGYEIRDLFIDRTEENQVGLFGEVGTSAGGRGFIRNVGLVRLVVTGGSDVGGLVGFNWDTVSNSYSAGSVAGEADVGGLVGANPGTVINSFWDVQSSGQVSVDGGTGKTTTQMKSLANFSDAGWNIIAVANPDTRNPSYIWNIVDGETYPFLSSQSVS